jgi:hypothetical protein
MAPEETMTTLCPSLIKLTAVSTMRESVESRGSWVFSWTMELEPVRILKSATRYEACPYLAYPI